MPTFITNKVRKKIKAELRRLKDIYKVIESCVPLDTEDLASGMLAANELAGIFSDLHTKVEKEHHESLEVADTAVVQYAAADINRGLDYLLKKYYQTLTIVKADAVDMERYDNLADIITRYGYNVRIDTSIAELALLSLNHPVDSPLNKIRVLRLMCYTSQKEWTNPYNTMVEFSLVDDTKITTTMAELPAYLVPEFTELMLTGDLYAVAKTSEPVKAPVEQVTISDYLKETAYLPDNFSATTLNRLNQVAIDCNRIEAYYYDLNKITTLQDLRDKVGNAKLLHDTATNKNYLFVTLSIAMSQAIHGYNVLHALYSILPSEKDSAILELVNNSEKSLIRVKAGGPFSNLEHESINQLLYDGDLPVFSPTVLTPVGDLPSIDNCDFARITNGENLTEYVTRLPSGTLTIDPRVSKKMSDLINNQRSILRKINNYSKFFTTKTTHLVNYLQGAYGHARLRNNDRYNGDGTDHLVVVSPDAADMILRLKCVNNYFANDNDDRDSDNTPIVTLTWKGIKLNNGGAAFPINHEMIHRLYFTFHTRDNTDGTPVKICDATNYELDELFAALEAQYEEWERMYRRDAPATVITNIAIQPSLPTEPTPEQLAVEAIVDGKIDIHDVRKY